MCPKVGGRHSKQDHYGIKDVELKTVGKYQKIFIT